MNPRKRPAKQFVVVGDENFDDIIPPGLFRGSHPNLFGDAHNRAIWGLCNARRVFASTEFWVLPLGNRGAIPHFCKGSDCVSDV